MQRHPMTSAAPLGSLLVGAAALGGAVSGPVARDLGAGQFQVTFVYQPPDGADTVHLAGSFNGWSSTATPMVGPDEDGRFRVAVKLERGRYEYKYVLNGHQWQTDPENPVKTGPHQNAVLFVGIPVQEDGGTIVRPAQEVQMAGRTAHPPDIEALARSLGEFDPQGRAAIVDRWFAGHPMPLIGRDAASFVLSAPDAEGVHLLIKGRGFWTGYQVPRLMPDASVFGVTLKRDQIPSDTFYVYEVERAGRTHALVDPQAWVVTSRSGKPVAVIAETDPARGRIQLLRDVPNSSAGLRPRDVYVYLPPGYRRDEGRRYPVLYMHDGQNCWDDPVEPFGHGGWQVNRTADRLIAAGTVKPFIVVGLANTPDRIEEYGPGADVRSLDDRAYIQYLIRDVKPQIDRRFSTDPSSAGTVLMGSSMGALVSMQAALLRPDVFGGAGCLSPAFWYKDGRGGTYFDLVAKVGKVDVRIYLDSGTTGPKQDGAADTRRMGELLKKTGWSDGRDLHRHEAAGAEHNERAWRARLDQPLIFFFGPTGSP
ncbi:MAG: hypothetical protein GY778_15695 [bacterium]|nr:hypothetical protein [bacterium]